MAKREQKPPRTCIFCGRTGLSKEHIWSDWLKAIIPRRGEHRQGSESFSFDSANNEFQITRPMMTRKKQGCVTSQKVRNVCQSHCNSGWMSRAVNAAKPVAMQLIEGERFQCGDEDLRKLITWLAITTIMQEYSAPGAVYIPAEDRRTLMETGEPPTHWTIWIGYYGGEHWNPVGHTHSTVKLEDRIRTLAKIPDCYVQIGTFALKKLLVHAFTATTSGIVAEYRDYIRSQSWNVLQIWPTTGDRLTWPRFPVFDGELERLILEFGRSRWNYTADLGFGRKRKL